MPSQDGQSATRFGWRRFSGLLRCAVVAVVDEDAALCGSQASFARSWASLTRLAFEAPEASTGSCAALAATPMIFCIYKLWDATFWSKSEDSSKWTPYVA
eukprot:CAMPEP_0172920508 /NCGR_PEP_ID=MMETSP1075-20121228/204247_1 /TAXON_ID=2916 /ORGANISM="Ceratium fusus, Strain PA161109" /LENGTH=99 /DNA_ID=CAMNT_0013780549 /DNA_START=14 /DNA_END=313 /DNA_ORIENTATION=+